MPRCSCGVRRPCVGIRFHFLSLFFLVCSLENTPSERAPFSLSTQYLNFWSSCLRNVRVTKHHSEVYCRGVISAMWKADCLRLPLGALKTYLNKCGSSVDQRQMKLLSALVSKVLMHSNTAACSTERLALGSGYLISGPDFPSY